MPRNSIVHHAVRRCKGISIQRLDGKRWYLKIGIKRRRKFREDKTEKGNTRMKTSSSRRAHFSFSSSSLMYLTKAFLCI